MEKRLFAGIGREISLLGFGLMRLPRLDPAAPDIDYARAEKMIARAIAAGVNYFDTAWMYHEGRSETFAGDALSRYPRASYCLATKCPPWLVETPDDVERMFDAQLQKCRTDYFDFYLIHGLNEDRYKKVRNLGLYDRLLKKKEQGLIRHLGFSFHDHPSLMERIAAEYPWDFAQIQLNYIDWTALRAKNLYEILSGRKIPVVIMEPVRGGALSSLPGEAETALKKAAPEASMASWAIRFAASLPGVLTVLSGMTAMEQLEDNLKTMNPFRPLGQDERAALEQAAVLYNAAGAIPCTGCRYCMDCPSGVNIPSVFAIYNHYRRGMSDGALARIVFGNNYNALRKAERADNCAACEQCVEKCPQQIEIPKRMEEITAFAQP
ncbi:MAG: aldo/keto reductase [Deltaproteobacteria bacterium]|jgi:predicted aldo/keto reductase-like oxidoreductase|nr:aldo/keto reductase [Deltaproteobacteria bacterium]